MKQGKVKFHEIVNHLLINVAAVNEKLTPNNPLDVNLQEAWKIFEEKFPYYEEFAHWFNGKDQKLSDKLKDAGNKAYKEKKFDDARRMYRLSIQVAGAPYTANASRQFISTILSNMSATYYEEEDWDNCIKCIRGCRDFCKEIKPSIEKKLQGRENRINSQDTNFDDFEDGAPGDFRPTGLSKEEHDLELNFDFVSNDDLPNVTYKAEIAKDAKYGGGRMMRATEDIEPGELIMVEPPIASCLVPNQYPNRCYHCAKKLIAPFPCRQCRGIAYCSEKCENTSWYDEGHSIECAHHASIVQSGGCHLVFKTLYKGIKKNPEYFKKNGAKDLPKVGKRPDVLASDYVSQHYSHTQNPDEDVDFEIVKGYIFFGIAFVRLLVQGGILDPEEHDLFRISQVFLKHSFQNQANAVCLQESTYNTNRTIQEYTPFATGFFPSIALMNHSCYPNTSFVFNGTKAHVIATSRISAGEEIVNNYGMLFTMSTKRERHEDLEQRYNFVCECDACKNDWPIMSKLKGTRYLKCPACFKTSTHGLLKSVKENCVHCKHEIDVQNCLQGLGQVMLKKGLAAETLKAGDLKNAFKQAISAVKQAHTYVGLPDYEILDFREIFLSVAEQYIQKYVF